MLKLDIGCGKAKRGPDWTGVDVRPFEGVDVVTDLREHWPWDDASVDEVWASHVLEHFERLERVHFMNELHRVLLPGRSATIITPHWCSTRAYGDLDHKWPPVSEMFYFYLNKAWRDVNAPHDDFYTCDFASPPNIGHAMRQDLQVRNTEYQQFALSHFKEVALDTICTLTKM